MGHCNWQQTQTIYSIIADNYFGQCYFQLDLCGWIRKSLGQRAGFPRQARDTILGTFLLVTKHLTTEAQGKEAHMGSGFKRGWLTMVGRHGARNMKWPVAFPDRRRHISTGTLPDFSFHSVWTLDQEPKVMYGSWYKLSNYNQWL